MKKQQVVIIHGGEPYDSYEDFLRALKTEKVTRDDFKKGSHNFKTWRDDLELKLSRTHEVFQPRMPNKDNSKYSEWKIWFEKLLPFIGKKPIFIGHSLGGIFLAKYFAENTDKRKLRALFLVAAPYGDNRPKYSVGDFALPSNLEHLEKLGSKIHLCFSKDDKVVPFRDLKKYRAALPEAQVSVFSDRGHFKLDSFPEILKDIRALKQA